MKSLGICLVSPEEKLLDELARGFFKAAYLDKSPAERALIDRWIDENSSEGTTKTAGFWSGTGTFLKGMFVDPAVDAVGNMGQYMRAARRGDWGVARRQLGGAALNGGMFALNFVPGGGIVGGVGRAGMTGLRMAGNLGRAAWLARAGVKGLGATGALASLGARGAQAGVGALNTGVNLARGASAAAPALSGTAKFLQAARPWAQGAGYLGMYEGGRLLNPHSNLATGAADIGLSNPNDPNSIVNTSAFGLDRGTTTGLPNVDRS